METRVDDAGAPATAAPGLAAAQAALGGSCEAIAADWARALDGHDPTIVRTLGFSATLRRITGLALNSLLSEPFDFGQARAAGVALETVLGPHLGRLGAALGTFASTLIQHLPAGEVPVLQPRLSACLGAMGSSYGEQARDSLGRTARELRSQNQKLVALQDTVRDLGSSRELNAVLESVVQRATTLLDATGGVLCHCDAGRREVRPLVTYNAPASYLSNVVKYGQGAGGWVAETGEGLIVEDYLAWANRPSSINDENVIRGLLSAPLRWQGQVTGVIHVFDLAPERRFSQEDLQVLTLFGDHAAIAIANASLHQRAQLELVERRQAEHTLGQAHRMLEAILASLDEVVVLVDPEVPQIRECHGQMEAIFGYRPDEVIGRDTRFLHVNDEMHGLFGEKVAAAMSDGSSLSMEFSMRRRNGEVFPSEHFIAPLYDSEGRLTRRVSVIRDVSERERTEALYQELQEQVVHAEALRRSSSQIGRALASGPDPESTLQLIAELALEIMQGDVCSVRLADESGDLILRAVAGNRPDAPVLERLPSGQGLMGIAVQTRVPVVCRDMQTDPRAFHTGHVRGLGSRSSLTIPLLVHGECLGAIAVTLRKVHDFSDNDIGVLTSFADQAASAVDQVRQNRRVADARSRLEGVLRHIPDGVFTTDLDCRIASFNPTAETLTGWSESEIMGRECGSLLGACDGAFEGIRPSAIPQRAISENRAISWSYRDTFMVTKQGANLPVMGATAPLHDSSGRVTGSVVSFRDASRDVEVDRLRSEFVGLISHELRSPLASLEAALTLLKERTGDRAAQGRSQDALTRQVSRLRGVVETLFAISELEAGRPSPSAEPIALDAFLRQTITSLFPPELAMRCVIKAPRGLIAVGSPQKSALVIRNLVDNALQYSPDESLVTVTAMSLDGEETVVSVADLGIGIAPEHTGQVFDRLFRAGPRGTGGKPGYGLGLYLSKLLVSGQGGRIWVESEVGKGSTFYFTLPLVKVAEEE
jgi:PAS domain S-box-containing protein